MQRAFTSQEELAAHLRQEQLRINEEIRAYPSPIAGCDAYFNSLLEERGRIADALRRLSDGAGER